CFSPSPRWTRRGSSRPSSSSRCSHSRCTARSRCSSGWSCPGNGSPRMRKALLAVALVLTLAACGGRGGGGGIRHATLTLDWTPNPDHVGFYYARDEGIFRKAGLDVAIHAPS